MSEQTTRAHRYAYFAVLAAFMAVVIWMTRFYLVAIFMGATLAILVYPAYRWLCAKGKKPYFSALTVITLLLILIVVPVAGFTIMAVKQGIVIGQNLTKIRGSSQHVSDTISHWPLVQTFFRDPEYVNSQVKTTIQNGAEYAKTGILQLARNIPQFLLQIILAVLACYFILLDGKHVLHWALNLGALDPHMQEKLLKSFRETSLSTIFASLTASSAQAVTMALGYFILGVPGAFLAGGATFILSWVPLLGTLPVWLAGMVYLYIQSSPLKVVFMLMFGLIASSIDNVVKALILRGSAAIHPIIGLIAILGGIHMFGIMGVFIGPSLAGMLIVLLKLWPEVGTPGKVDLISGNDASPP